MSPRTLLVALLALTACHAGALSKRDPGGNSGRDGGGAEAPSFGLPPPTDAPPPGVNPLGPGSEMCAEEAVGAELLPLDLVLVLDASGSMRIIIDGKTRWTWVSEAITAFVRDPGSAGMGVGLQVFPFTILAKPCTKDEDCGTVSPGQPNYWCTQPYVCADPAVPLAMARPCDPNDAFCPMGVKCVQAGKCAGSGARCLNLGQACPGGGGTCGTAGTVCKFQIDSCEPGDYQSPRVGIAALPGSGPALVQGLTAVKPGGNTPIAPAIDGVAAHVRQYLATQPGHRAVLVLASDGAPGGCDGSNEAHVATRLAAALAGTPALPTYVIGVVEASDTNRVQVMNNYAMAGGTTTPFILNASAADLGQKFLAALNQIRSMALPCEFTIPPPSKGDIDYQRVNVRYAGLSSSTDLFYVGSADRCDPMQGGWYYDVPPSAGTPMRVRVCEASCRKFQAEPGGKVELRFGCQTRIK